MLKKGRQYLASIDWRVPLLAALVIISASTSFEYHRLLLEQHDQIEHTYQVMSALEQTLQLITDAETGPRGFILTGNETYLAPYVLAVAEVKKQLGQLRQLVRDSSTQLARLSILELALGDKVAELKYTIEIAEHEGTEKASKLVQNDVGRERMDRVRRLIAKMRNAEAELMIDRMDRAKRTEKTMLMVTVFLAMVSIAARWAIYLIGRRRTT